MPRKTTLKIIWLKNGRVRTKTIREISIVASTDIASIAEWACLGGEVLSIKEAS